MELIASILFLLPLLFYSPQEKSKWQRLYTYEDSTVEVDASNIIFSTDFTGRVRFRFAFSKLQPLAGKQVRYKSVIETIEFKCEQNRYRVVDVQRYDNKGTLVDSDAPTPSAVWEDVKARSMMEKFFQPGCHVIYEKRRNP
jgi:hypothetical protein